MRYNAAETVVVEDQYARSDSEEMYAGSICIFSCGEDNGCCKPL